MRSDNFWDCLIKVSFDQFKDLSTLQVSNQHLNLASFVVYPPTCDQSETLNAVRLGRALALITCLLPVKDLFWVCSSSCLEAPRISHRTPFSAAHIGGAPILLTSLLFCRCRTGLHWARRCLRKQIRVWASRWTTCACGFWFPDLRLRHVPWQLAGWRAPWWNRPRRRCHTELQSLWSSELAACSTSRWIRDDSGSYSRIN